MSFPTARSAPRGWARRHAPASLSSGRRGRARRARCPPPARRRRRRSPARNRVASAFVTSPGCAGRAGSSMDRLADSSVAPAAAHLPIHHLVGVGVARLRLLLEERAGRKDHPRLAVAALRDVLLDPGLLAAVRAVARQALDGGEALARRLGDRHLAGAHRAPVLEDGAGPADADAAAVLCAGEPELVAEHPEERRVGLGGHGAALAVYNYNCRSHAKRMNLRGRTRQGLGSTGADKFL